MVMNDFHNRAVTGFRRAAPHFGASLPLQVAAENDATEEPAEARSELTDAVDRDAVASLVSVSPLPGALADSPKNGSTAPSQDDAGARSGLQLHAGAEPGEVVENAESSDAAPTRMQVHEGASTGKQVHAAEPTRMQVHAGAPTGMQAHAAVPTSTDALNRIPPRTSADSSGNDGVVEADDETPERQSAGDAVDQRRNVEDAARTSQPSTSARDARDEREADRTGTRPTQPADTGMIEFMKEQVRVKDDQIRVKGAQVWDERIGSARVQAKNWRYMTFGSLILSAGFASALVWQSGRGTIAPWVLQVDNLGQAQAVAPAVADYRPTEPQIAWHLARFIEQVRSIPADAIIVRQTWLRAYDFTTDRGAMALNADIRSVLETARRRSITALNAIKLTLQGEPLASS